MPHRHTNDRNPSPDDRRQMLRRETDQENQEIVDHAVEDAPLVRQLLNTGKLAAALIAFFSLLSVCGTLLGVKLLSPSDVSAQAIAATNRRVAEDSGKIMRNSQRIDSVQMALPAISRKLDEIAHTQCVQLRLDHPSLRPDGCDK